MLQNYNKYKVLKIFFDDPLPEGGYGLREISRKIRLSPLSVKLYLDELEKEGFIKKKTIHNRPFYFGDRENPNFKLYKKNNTVLDINDCGLLDFLWDSFMPDSIILFGSASKGEDVKNSDIDIFIAAKEKNIDLKKYEKTLNRSINLFCSEHFTNLSSELKNNILNGIALKGYLKVF